MTNPWVNNTSNNKKLGFRLIFFACIVHPSLGTIDFGTSTPLCVKKADIPIDKMDINFQRGLLDVTM